MLEPAGRDQRYRHVSSLDIDIEVRGFLGKGDDYVSLIVAFWNRTYKIYQGRQQQVVHIKIADFWKWKKVSK